MEEFSPYELKHYALLVGSLALFYLLGSPFYRSDVVHKDVAVRLGLGAIVFVVLNAVAHAGLGSMMILLIPFFIALGWNRFKNDPSPSMNPPRLKEQILSLLIIGVIGVAVLSLEASRFDLRDGTEHIYVGNTDISFYSAHGQMMYYFGKETLATSVGEHTQKVLYHFSDLWLSGFYSKYFDVVPYYAYGLLYRSAVITILLALFFALFHEYVHWPLAVLGTLLSLLGNNAVLYLIPTFGVDLLSPLSTNWPIYAESSYLLPSVAFVLSLLLIRGNRTTNFGLLGLMLLGVVHSSFVVPSFIFAFLAASVLWVFPGLIGRKNTSESKRWGLILLAAGTAPYLYVVLDQRGFPLEIDSIKNIIYLSAHTAIRVMLTVVLLFPILAGVAYSILKSETANPARSAVAYFLAGAIGFCLLFAIFQSSNTIKLFTAIYFVVLFPVGVLGLLAMIRSTRPTLKWVSAVFLLALGIETCWSLNVSHGHELIYSWEQNEGYRETHTYPLSEVQNVHKLLTGKLAGFIVCDESNYQGGMIRYNEFIGLSSLIPQSFVFRINAMDGELGGTKEGRAWVKKSAPFEYQERFATPLLATESYLDWLSPDFLLSSIESTYCIPDEIAITEQVKELQFNGYRFWRTKNQEE